MPDLQSIKTRFGIIGNSPALNHALDVAVQVSSTDLSVLIVGESGVGKEAFSHIIHALSSRKHNPFIAVNCGAIPEGTIDSELFGHEKGAFTGAVDARKGYFETVSGGTIFLDEIGEMPLGTQARLLRVLETGEFIRVGSSKVQKTDVRVIAATNRELLEFAQKGRFREDLYYRLSTVPIRVPALRDRKEDIPLLFRKFVVDFSERYRTTPVQLDDEARGLLMNAPFKGNVRELKNLAEQMSVLSPSQQIGATILRQFLPDKPAGHNLPVLSSQIQQGQPEFQNERELLYKLFFDMKKDVTELKKMFVELLQNPSLAGSSGHFVREAGHAMMQDADLVASYNGNNNAGPVYHANPPQNYNAVPNIGYPQNQPQHNGGPVLLNQDKPAHSLDKHEVVEPTLNLMEMEKELIVMALKKHKGKRKDASLDLGISERTLYRKLKEYDIEE